LRVSNIEVEKALSAMDRDKKRRAKDDHRFVLLQDVGRPVWGVSVGEVEARRAIGAIVG
jgi:3-dehydroquinate synthase